MSRVLATKTLAAIDRALYADQGSAYRGHLEKVLPQMGDAYRTGKEDFRSHMGASGIGKECGRAIWYGFRWHTPSRNEGRIIRLFNRGHLEEARFIALLLTIGCQVWQQDENGKQFAVAGSEGHFGGSGDGVVMGLPDLPPKTPALCEFKTHGSKSFKKLEDEGMRSAKFEHYVQMQTYMRKMVLPYGFYLAVNKDTDALYAEIVYLDTEIADRFAMRADKIVWMKQAPSRMPGASAGSFKCRFCEHRPVCHLDQQPAVNCRTCRHSYPAVNKQWGCIMHNIGLTKEAQLAGCSSWTKIDEDVNAGTA